MEPLITLYLEHTQVGDTTALYSDSKQEPFEHHYILLDSNEYDMLGRPTVIEVQIKAFQGDPA